LFSKAFINKLISDNKKQLVAILTPKPCQLPSSCIQTAKAKGVK
jgi:hypothetical protein